ncbi:uncharacterized protein N7459_009531 [Penicillium hispanicum]|uniref:uncharacterized protein n=1 Tax=Penicillium hispanicum TaxID=1080232 RepID=UPI0025421383|nr:uncharacterized protein N7459_009531 [Penicillium hispanicum]KAJ5570101.1 hypothetical protein N7459_009531 [Penicillium hispanicum]
MAPERTPTETSPLLNNHNDTTFYEDPESHCADSSDGREATVDQPVESSHTAPSIARPSLQSQLKYIVPAISVGVFMSAADQTIIVASSGAIGTDLSALNLTSWIATSYFLALTSFQPLYGKLSDIFGRKACLLAAYSIFGAGCLLCGLARNIYELIFARVFQGIGGGGMTTVASILLSDMVPLRDRGVWQGLVNLVYATGSAVGAPLGGILADSIGWRWAFIVQVPLSIIASIAVSLMLNIPSPADSGSCWKAKLRRIDLLGAATLIGAVLSLLLGLDRGSNVSWKLPITIASLGVSGFLSALFVLVEIYVAAEPVMPGYILFDRNFLALYSSNFFGWAGWLSVLFYLPLYFQTVDGVSATVAGLRLLPSILASVSGSLLSGFIIKWTGRYYRLTVTAYALLAMGCSLLFLFSSGVVKGSVTIPIMIGMAMAAFGNGLGVTATLIGLISHTTEENQAVVTACSYLFRSLGSVIGLSLSSTVIQQALRGRLRHEIPNGRDVSKIVNGVRQSLDFIKNLDPDMAEFVRACYGWSINKGLVFMFIIVSFALLSACFCREKNVSRR